VKFYTISGKAWQLTGFLHIIDRQMAAEANAQQAVIMMTPLSLNTRRRALKLSE